jgi:retinol dehydrogenase-12
MFILPKISFLSLTIKIEAKMHWDDLYIEKGYTAFAAYCQSKLANCLFTVELAKRLNNTGVIAVSLHPGIVDTELWRKREDISFGTKAWRLVLMSVSKCACCGKNSAKGSETSVFCATNENVVNQSGQYFE